MKLDDISRSYILAPYLHAAVVSLRHKVNNQHSIATECVYCGEKKLKGTLFLANTNRWCYICWKPDCPCSTAISAERWLKRVNRSQYDMFKKDLRRQETEDVDTVELRNKAEEANAKAEAQQAAELEKRRTADNYATKFFKPILSGGAFADKAIDYCKSRKIPEEIWRKFYIAEDGKYKGRVIIPFYNANDRISYFQGRSLTGAEPKYMNRCSTSTVLYNYDFLDKEKPVCVLEGPIDSMFIENATATCGAGSSAKLDQALNSLKHVYYIMDNDAAGNKKAGKLVKDKKNVFVWRKFIIDNGLPENIKDINDVYLHLNRTTKFTFEELEPYFTDIRDEFLCYL